MSGYFDRLRTLAAGPPPARLAAARDRARPAWLLEHEEVRVAAVPTPSPVEPRPEPVAVPPPRPAAPSPEPGAPIAVEAPAVPARERPARAADSSAAVSGVEASPSRTDAGVEDRSRPAEPAVVEREVVVESPAPAQSVSTTGAAPPRLTPATVPVIPVGSMRSIRSDPEGTAPARSSLEDGRPSPPSAPAEEAAPRRPRSPEEGLHEALVRVRRWMAEPAAEVRAAEPEADASGPSAPWAPEPASRRIVPPPRRAADRPAPAAPVEERTEVSIGTIHVTVEEPEGGARRPVNGAGPAASAARPSVVPRHYVRGW